MIDGVLFAPTSFLAQVTGVVKPILRRRIPLPFEAREVDNNFSSEPIYSPNSQPLTLQSATMHMQVGKCGEKIQGLSSHARSANICPALSSHIVQIPDIVVNTSPAVERSGPCLGEANAWRVEYEREHKRRIAFEQKCEKANRRCADFEKGLKNAAGKYRDLETKYETVSEKFKNLKWKFESVCGKCQTLEQNLVVTAARFEYLENLVGDLQERIQDLQSENSLQHTKLNHEIARGLFLENEIHHIRRDNQRLRAQIAEQSGDGFREEGSKPKESDVASMVQPLQTDRHLQFVLKQPPANSDGVDHLPREVDFGRIACDHIGEFQDRRLQEEAGDSQEVFHDLQIRSMATTGNLINWGPTKLSSISIIPQAQLGSLDVRLCQQRPQLHIDVPTQELGATVSNGFIREQLKSVGVNSATPQLPEKMPTRSLSGSHQKNSDLTFEPPNLTLATPEGENPKSIYPPYSLPTQQPSELCSDATYKNDETENYQSNSATLSGFGSRRIQIVSPIYRLRIPAQETKLRDEVCSMLHLNTWEWSSVPDLQLWDFKPGN